MKLAGYGFPSRLCGSGIVQLLLNKWIEVSFCLPQKVHQSLAAGQPVDVSKFQHFPFSFFFFFFIRRQSKGPCPLESKVLSMELLSVDTALRVTVR